MSLLAVHAGRRDGEDLGGGVMIWNEEEEPYGGVTRVAQENGAPIKDN